MPSNIANIYVMIFGKYLQFLNLVVICIIYPELYVRFPNIIFNIHIIKHLDIYIGNTGSLLLLINICPCREIANIIC